MMDLTRDAHGHTVARPSGLSYYDAIAQSAGPIPPLPDFPATVDPSAPVRMWGMPWRIWRTTDPEDGTAPDFDTISRAVWFDKDMAPNTDACAAAWRYLARFITDEQRGYGPGVHLQRTPGATGLMLVMHSLPWGKNQPRPFEYPTLDAPTARLLAAIAPQHRQEHLAGNAPQRAQMRRYAVYDARVAHLAYLRHLPVLLGAECASGPIHDEGATVEPYRAGKYRCLITVPRGWQHVGLAHRAARDGARWEWPAAPGDEWESWLDESEVRLLADHGWPYRVLERIVFASGKEPGSDPIREHQARLASEIERLDALWREGNRAPAIAAARAGLRAIALHPIGLWHKHTNERTRHVDSLDELTAADADADLTPDADGQGGYTVTTREELSPWQAHWRRLEWSTTVYARERVAAARKALTIPRHHLLAFDGDAVHTADWLTGLDAWVDTGRVGCYRLDVAWSLPGARRLPGSLADVRRLKAEAKGKGNQHGMV